MRCRLANSPPSREPCKGWRLQARRRATAGLAVFLVLGNSLAPLLAAPDAAQPGITREVDADMVVAAYLLNFLRYVEWPEAVPPGGEPWRIGLLNAKDLGGPLARMTAGKTVRGRSIAVVNAASAAEAGGCQIVFLSASLPNLSVDLDSFKGRPVLTVVYGEEADADGAMIVLMQRGQSIRYSLRALRLSPNGLRPTPGLLENALPAAEAQRKP